MASAHPLTVLVTGGSGFIGSHCIARLLGFDKACCVRTTVRSADREAAVRRAAGADGRDAGGRLAVFIADLTSDDDVWAEATAGCDYVLHVASPFPLRLPQDSQRLIDTAVDGALRVLGAALAAGVKRVVLTSSFTAVGCGHAAYDRVLTEADWSDTQSPHVDAYEQSKTLAERAAWSFAAQHPALELAVVNPVGVFGPLLGPHVATSVEVVRRILAGQMPLAPHFYMGVVDVRDVAELHVRAMTHPAAAGQRFLAIAGDGRFVTFADIGRALGVTVRLLPDWLTRAAAYISPDVRRVAGDLGIVKQASNAHAAATFGVTFRTTEEALVATAESLKQFKIV